MIETVEYVAGGWEAVLEARRHARRGAWRIAGRTLRYRWQYLARQARRGNWRAVRNSVIKPYRCESVGPCPRVGWAWTRAGARRHLGRLLAES